MYIENIIPPLNLLDLGSRSGGKEVWKLGRSRDDFGVLLEDQESPGSGNENEVSQKD